MEIQLSCIDKPVILEILSEWRFNMKKWVIATSLLLGLVLVTGCDNNKSNKTADSSEKIGQTTSSSNSSQKSAETSMEENTKEQQAGTSGEWEAAEKTLKAETEAETVELIYENKEPIISETDDAKVTIEGYCYYQIENFSRNMDIPFGNQHEKGGVVIIDASIQNKKEQKVYVGPGFSLSLTGYNSAIMRKKELLSEDLVSDLVKNGNELDGKAELRDFVALAIKPEAMDKFAEHGEAMLEIPGIYSKKDSFKSEDTVLAKKEVSIPFNLAGEKKVEAAGAFYEDKATVENMGTKTMLASKELNETKEFEGIKVTFAGYQFTDFAPNEDQASRFKKFETGVILLTTKLNVKNDGKEAIKFGNTAGSLTIGNSVKILSQNGLEVTATQTDLASGEEATKYLVFAMDKEAYEKLYHEQEFKLAIRLYDSKFASMTSLDDVAFTFKNE